MTIAIENLDAAFLSVRSKFVVQRCSTNSPSARIFEFRPRRMTITRRHWHLRASFLLVFLLVVSPLLPTVTAATRNFSDSAENDPSVALSQILRLERVEVPGGAELITVHAKLQGLGGRRSHVPLRSLAPTADWPGWRRRLATPDRRSQVIARVTDCSRHATGKCLIQQGR